MSILFGIRILEQQPVICLLQKTCYIMELCTEEEGKCDY